jgi:hypothetical protein
VHQPIQAGYQRHTNAKCSIERVSFTLVISRSSPTCPPVKLMKHENHQRSPGRRKRSNTTYVFPSDHYRNFHGRHCHASIKYKVSTTIRGDQWTNTLLIYRPVDPRRPRLSVLELGTQTHYPTLLRTFDTEYTYPSYNTHNNFLWRESNFPISVEVSNVGYGLSLPPNLSVV